MSRTFAEPRRLLEYAGELLPAEAMVAGAGPELDRALIDFQVRCPDFGFCPAITGDELVRHTDRGRTLAEWIGAVGAAFAAADTLPGAPGSPVQSIGDPELGTYLDAVGAFLSIEEAESHAAGLAYAAALRSAVGGQDLVATEQILRGLAAFEHDGRFMQAFLLGSDDLDGLLDRVDALVPRGNVAQRFLGGLWDSVRGTAQLAWGLTGRIVHDPSGWAGTWGDLGSSLWWGVQNPGEFALAIIDWDGLRDDPARWLGGLAPDVVLTFATAGGAAAGRGSSASRRAVATLRGAEDLGTVVSATRQLGQAARLDLSVRLHTLGGRRVTWSPAGRASNGRILSVSARHDAGPLSRLPRSVVGHDPTATFRGAQYLARTTDRPMTLYRVYTPSPRGGAIGQYWTTVPPTGQSQAILDSALRPDWGNTATHVTEVRVPAGQVVYEGFAAPQPTVLSPGTSPIGELMGGGPQVYVPNVPEGWIVRSERLVADGG